MMLSLAGPLAAEPQHRQVQRGTASYYHPQNFTNRPMANGDRFDPNSNAAAHRTLPLGTVADVTNLSNGETRRVVIEDRGPYVGGRVIDLSPRIADELGMRHAGLAPVEVRPVGQLPNRGRDGQSGLD
ncbi:septal ring lytic transglycosylase RlpA family protein [Falsiroseomonas sp. HW251]|uniref:septal ring lytic transglycosylase RlpA family protein n=1 Tax=Falsiroseomonas sp. HW251 TaxID=3390998 RepID=UPI003D3101FB